MRLIGLLMIATLAGSLGACGQKGPLVLPDAQHPRKRIGLPKPRAPTTDPAQPSAPTPVAPTPPPPP